MQFPVGIDIVRWLLRNRYIRPWIKNLIRRYLSAENIQTLGCQFLVHPGDNHTEYMLWLHGALPEQTEISFLVDLLKGTDATLVDVGANVGGFSLPILLHGGAKARLYAFEPNPIIRQRLKTNIALNGFAHTQIFDCAIGDQAGPSRLYIPKGLNYGAARADIPFQKGGSGLSQDIRIRPLHDVLGEANLTQIDLLKVDVEGLEGRVIVPLLNADTGVLPRYIYFEVAHKDHWKYPIIDELEAKGYSLLQDFGANQLFRLETDLT